MSLTEAATAATAAGKLLTEADEKWLAGKADEAATLWEEAEVQFRVVAAKTAGAGPAPTTLPTPDPDTAALGETLRVAGTVDAAIPRRPRGEARPRRRREGDVHGRRRARQGREGRPRPPPNRRESEGPEVAWQARAGGSQYLARHSCSRPGDSRPCPVQPTQASAPRPDRGRALRRRHRPPPTPTGRPGCRAKPAAAITFGPPADPGEVGTLGPYRVVKELGRGGMGAVYAASTPAWTARLALKVMLPRVRRRRRREGAVPPRGPGRRADHARQRRHRLRGRRARRRPVHRHAVPRRATRSTSTSRRRAARPLAAGPADRPRDGRRAGRGPRARPGPPRHQARATCGSKRPHGRVKVLDFGLRQAGRTPRPS